MVKRKNVLQSCMEKSGMKQEEFARKLGISQPHANSLINGHRWAGPIIQERIIKVTGIDPAKLIKYFAQIQKAKEEKKAE